MPDNQQKQNQSNENELGNEIAIQYSYTLYDAIIKLRERGNLLQAYISDWEVLKAEFLGHYNRDHAAARSDYDTLLLDSHKLAALSILAVKKSKPLLRWDGFAWKRENRLNDVVAILLAADIMRNYRDYDFKACSSRYNEDVTGTSHTNAVTEFLSRFPFPNSVTPDRISPLDRLILVLNDLDMQREPIIHTIRHLAYDCYLLDAYHRGLLGHFLLASS